MKFPGPLKIEPAEPEPLDHMALVDLMVDKIKQIGRPLSIDELMPLCLPLTPHVMHHVTGKIHYFRESFSEAVQAGVKAGRLMWKAEQVRGVLTYATSELPRDAETHS